MRLELEERRRRRMHHRCHCFIIPEQLSSWAAEQLQRLPYTLLHLRTALHSRNHFFISSSSHHYLSHHQAFMEGNLAGCPWVFSLSEFQYVGLCVVWCIVFHNIPSLALDPTLYYTDRNQMFILPMSSKKKFSSCREQNFQSFYSFPCFTFAGSATYLIFVTGATGIPV